MTVLLGDPAVVDLVAAHGRDAVVNTLREAVERCRSTVLADAGQETDCSTAAIVRETKTAIESSDGPNLRRIVNATGIVLHTGLGRAVLPQASSRVRHLKSPGSRSSHRLAGTPSWPSCFPDLLPSEFRPDWRC